MDASAAFAHRIQAHTNPRSSNRIGAERDGWIVRLAQIGPVWIDLLLQIRLFGTRQNATRRLATLEQAGRLRYAGVCPWTATRRPTSGVTGICPTGCSGTRST